MTVKDYLDLPYHIVIQRLDDESGTYYFVAVSELSGCMSHGDSYEEAFKNIREAMELWIEGGFPEPIRAVSAEYLAKIEERKPEKKSTDFRRLTRIEEKKTMHNEGRRAN